MIRDSSSVVVIVGCRSEVSRHEKTYLMTIGGDD